MYLYIKKYIVNKIEVIYSNFVKKFYENSLIFQVFLFKIANKKNILKNF